MGSAASRIRQRPSVRGMLRVMEVLRGETVDARMDAVLTLAGGFC